MKIAIAQLNPTIGDLTGNARQILAAAQQAASNDVRLLLTPELSLCGYPPRDLLLNPGFITAMGETLTQLAADLPPQIAVLVGTAVPNNQAQETGSKPLFNSTALLEQGQIRQIFYKRLLPTYDVFDEDRYFEPGNQANIFTLSIPDTEQAEAGNLTLNQVTVGVTICEDLWNDEEFWGKRTYAINPIAALANLGVDLIINLSASPYTVSKQVVREAMLRHAAIRHSVPLIYVNQVGGNDDLIFDGSSVAFDRQGEPVYRAPAFESDWSVLTFDPQQCDLLPSTVHLLPESEDEEIWKALVLGVRDYVHKCGFTKVVIGLSGGIDSSLVAAIATAAVGPDNVLGILMPSPYSSDHSIQDALDLAANLGIQTQIIPISDLMAGYDQALNKLFANTPSSIAEENIQSRIRGNLLMAISNKFGHLLISTGNKSELAVGYCTLYGDMNGGLAAIADVPKTRVYSICHWLNQHVSEILPERIPSTGGIIPEHVLTKAPSAELKPGQTDQDSLPPYEILDDILHRLIHEHQTISEIIASGHSVSIVERVARLVNIAEFKRRQAPPGLKITDRAFGTGWRMPIAKRGP